MSYENLLKQIEFIKEMDKLKYIERRTRLLGSDRHENDAEHSWHLAVMAMVLAEHANQPVDLLKVIKMVLIHDIVEIDAGDTFIYDKVKSHDNSDEERAAGERIFGMLPAAQYKEMMELWEEFEAGETHEARFARTMDRLEPLLQNISNRGGTWREYDVKYDEVAGKKSVMRKGSESIWQYALNLLNESVEQGILKK